MITSSMEITWDIYELFLYREIDREINDYMGNIDLDVDGISAATMPLVNFNRADNKCLF